jgi:hypothetical protein
MQAYVAEQLYHRKVNPESPVRTTNLPQETSVPRENYKPATSLRRWRALSQETRENYKSAHYVQNSQP